MVIKCRSRGMIKCKSAKKTCKWDGDSCHKRRSKRPGRKSRRESKRSSKKMQGFIGDASTVCKGKKVMDCNLSDGCVFDTTCKNITPTIIGKKLTVQFSKKKEHGFTFPILEEGFEACLYCIHQDRLGRPSLYLKYSDVLLEFLKPKARELVNRYWNTTIFGQSGREKMMKEIVNNGQDENINSSVSRIGQGMLLNPYQLSEVQDHLRGGGCDKGAALKSRMQKAEKSGPYFMAGVAHVLGETQQNGKEYVERSREAIINRYK